MSTAQPPTTSAYPDRSTRLMLAGIFQILLGCFCGLMVLMVVAGSLLGRAAQAPHGQALNTPAMIQAGVLYLLLAVAFIWLGIGLAGARRWAWTLTVVVSWMWLIVGVISFFSFMCLMGPSVWAAIAEQSKASPEAMTAMRIAMGVVLACIYILLPGMFLLLCHHESVRTTCLRRDPKIRWTDRCPMPVLALSIMFALSLVSMFSLVAYRCVVPVFGVFVSGAAGAAVIVLIDVVLAYLAWGTYRLQMAAWWGALLLGIAGTVNMVHTISRIDPMQMYQKMGMPAD
jgi:hypothetical protein